MIFYTSDTHFGHKNVIQFDERPFTDIEEMDQLMIQMWNNRVQKDDTVYIVGDFAYRNGNSEIWYLRQLHGHKNLVIGNHDGNLLKNDQATAYFDNIDKMMHVTDGQEHICLCHFPLCEWYGARRGNLHIYGHIHNRKDKTYEIMKNISGAYNAGCMINYYMPVTLKELIQNNELFSSL